jgi:hypothetical protein
MDKGNVVYMHYVVLFSHKKEWDYIIFMKKDGTRDHDVKKNNPDSER